MSEGVVDPRLLRRLEGKVRSLARTLAFRRARCYRATFTDPQTGVPSYEQERTLADLRTFCRAGGRGTLHGSRDMHGRLDPINIARLEGRREVFLRIIEHLNLDDLAVQQLQEVSDE